MIGSDTSKIRIQQVILNLASLGAPLMGALISIPILLKHLSPEAFGLLGMYWVIIGYAGIFELGMGRAVTRQLSMEKGNDESQIHNVIGTGVLTALFVGTAAAIIIWFILPGIFGRFIKIPTDLQVENQIAIHWISLAVPALVVTSVLNGILEALKKFGWIAIIRIPSGLAMFVIPAILASRGFGLADLLFGIVFVRIVMAIALMIPIEREFSGALRRLRFDLPKSKELLKFGGWLTISAILGPLLVYMDRFILSSQYGLSVAAIYTTPFEAVIRFLIIPSAVVGVMFPRFVEAANALQGQRRRLFLEANSYVFLGVLPVTLLFVFFGKPVFSFWLASSGLTNDDINLTASLASLLSIGVLINACAHAPQAFIQAHGRANWTALLHIMEFGLYLSFAPYLIAVYGITGAAYAWIIRSVISAVALYFLSTRLKTAAW